LAYPSEIPACVKNMEILRKHGLDSDVLIKCVFKGI
jgi:hypothetical protein